MTLRVLILGGYGTFGGRLARLLSDEAGVDLIIAGRSLERAAAFCDEIGGSPARVDRTGDLAAQLAPLKPGILVDASGPFQAYGDDPYRVVRACLALGIDYLDLADAAAFVEGVAAFDEQARAAGRVVLSGLSTVPALSFAAARALAADMEVVEDLTTGIAPTPYAGMGLSVVRAVLGYAGRRVPLVRDGQAASGRAIVETRRRVVAPPGALPLRSRLFSLVEAPDLRLAAAVFPGLRNVWTGGGPAPEVLHRLLIALAWMRAPVSGLGRLFHRVSEVVRWGEDRGGMFVEVAGRRHGAPLRRTWHLIAEGADGPFIPAMAAAAIIRRRLAGDSISPGARAATGDLTLEDFEPLFAARRVVTGVREEPVSGPVFARVLGPPFDRLPAQVRALHADEGDAVFEGAASVERGRHIGARLIAAIVGFPKAGSEVPLRVEIERREGRERWRRIFAGKPFQSVLSEGRGSWAHMAEERFGPVSFAIALVLDGDRLNYVVRGWKLLGVHMPGWLTPGGTTFEHDDDGRFAFDVEISVPIVGRIVRYRGWLSPAAPAP